jgi:hypothetical protein
MIEFAEDSGHNCQPEAQAGPLLGLVQARSSAIGRSTHCYDTSPPKGPRAVRHADPVTTALPLDYA